MERDEIVKLFIRYLDEMVPNRDVCKVATESQLDKIDRMLDCEDVEDFLRWENLDLTVEELTEMRMFEAIYYMVVKGYAEEEIFDIWDARTNRAIQDVKYLLEISPKRDISVIGRTKLLRYARSKKADM